ncbi:hypothetical protein [Belliella pelovolcani]|uniref:AAA domain-containing protein n=1 Tax=Belliella pelovolcani TaxID=529505 RepID=A0A1N7PCI2_9BACT|nr:hypothetical protein [Belliella pelovolcani]SIT08268.1 hypothetical protein SAMN05421761_11558 [Belliella pelovolcani]
MKYKRAIASLFLKRLLPNKVVLLIGPRRVGKTIFIKSFMEGIPKEKLKDFPFVVLLKPLYVLSA